MKRAHYETVHEDYRHSVRSYLEKNVAPYYLEWEDAGIVPRDLFTGLGEIGAFGFDVPEEYGGSGISDFRFNAILTEEAYALGVGPALLGPTLQADIVTPYLVGLTTAEQKQRWLPRVATGETITAIAMTEPGTGSNLAGIRSKAVRKGDHYIIEGTKTFITNGMNADLVVVAARTSDDPHRGLSLFVVESGVDGFARGRKLRKMGLHAQDTAELAFGGVCVPVENRLGLEGEGFFALTRNLSRERLSLAVAAMAGARTALEQTITYVRDRVAFGAPIGALQNTRFRLAEVDTEIDLGTQYVDRCVDAYNAGELTHVDAAKAKWWTTELQGRVLDVCVQLHGGYGYMHEYPVARAWGDARVSRIYGGTTEIMKEIVGRSLQLG